MTNEWRGSGFVELARINSQGLRDAETPERRAGDARVLVLGDSMTFGHGVGDDETYPNQLEALFRRQGADVHVINAGIKGYGTDHAYRFFVTRLRSLRPDLVIFAFYTNDLPDDIDRPLYALEAGRLVPLDATRHRIYRIGRIYQWLPRALRQSRLVELLTSRIAGIGAYPEPPVRRPRELIQAVRDRILVQLAELERLSEEDGFRLIVLGVPYRERDPAKDHYRFLHAADLGGVDWFDLSDDPEWQLEGEALFLREDEHLSAAGHRRLAERLHRHIVEDDLL